MDPHADQRRHQADHHHDQRVLHRRDLIAAQFFQRRAAGRCRYRNARNNRPHIRLKNIRAHAGHIAHIVAPHGRQ